MICRTIFQGKKWNGNLLLRDIQRKRRAFIALKLKHHDLIHRCFWNINKQNRILYSPNFLSQIFETNSKHITKMSIFLRIFPEFKLEIGDRWLIGSDRYDKNLFFKRYLKKKSKLWNVNHDQLSKNRFSFEYPSLPDFNNLAHTHISLVCVASPKPPAHAIP